MSNQKTKITQNSKPDLRTRAWAYISIAGALVAIIYAGLSLQEEESKRLKRNYESVQRTSTPADSTAKKEETPNFNNLQDPSH